MQKAHNHISTETPHKCVCCGRLCFQQSIPKYNIFKQSIPKYNMARSRFKLNVSAGSQKRTIHKPEGKDESRFSLKSKRNINVTIVKYILSLFGQTLSLLGQTICVGLDGVSKTLPVLSVLFPARFLMKLPANPRVTRQ